MRKTRPQDSHIFIGNCTFAYLLRCLIAIVASLTITQASSSQPLERPQLLISSPTPSQTISENTIRDAGDEKKSWSDQQKNIIKESAYGMLHNLLHDPGINNDLNQYYYDHRNSEMDSDKITNRYEAGLLDHVTQKLTSKVELIQQMRKGLSMQIDLRNMFSTTPTKITVPQRAGIKYGLVLKSLEPDLTGVKQTALGQFNPKDLELAGKSKVRWDIGPVDHSGKNKVFNVANHSENTIIEKTDDMDLWDTAKYRWDHWQAPPLVFKGKLIPEAFGASANDAKSPKTPPINLTINQINNLYVLKYSNSPEHKDNPITHEVRAPIANNCYIAAHANKDGNTE